MVYSADELNSSEGVVLDLRPHWWYFSSQVAALVAALLLYLAVEIVFDPTNRLLRLLAVIPFVIASLWLAARFVAWITTRFVLTTDRLINRSGILRRQGIEIPLDRVNTVFFSQTLFERLIGSGDLVIESAGEQGQQMFSDIRKPLVVQNQIHTEMEANAERRYRREPSDTSNDVVSQIDRLDQLRQRGAISQEEFDTKKAELLNRL